MTTTEARNQSRLARIGWRILIFISAILLLNGINWLIGGPEMALDNIAERTSLVPGEFREGNPSAFDVITLIARQNAAGYIGLGLLGLLIAWKGYRSGSHWAWRATWLPVLVFAANGVSFILAAGGTSAVGFGISGLAAVGLLGQLLAGRELSS